jgi:uncharacterized protein (DUF305 family)
MNHHSESAGSQEGGSQQMNHYLKLLIMAALSFVSMYILMYAMVNQVGNIYPNVNQFYMAGLMTSPMVILEVLLMRQMYSIRRWNTLILAGSLLLGLLFFALIRQQTAVSDHEFLRSMIPHHAGAILMCQHANIQDPEIQALCRTIISSQQAEIDQMKAMLRSSDQ